MNYKILFPKAVSHLDRFFIVNSESNCIIEGHFGRERADYFCNVCNEHEIKNGRKPVYIVISKEEIKP